MLPTAVQRHHPQVKHLTAPGHEGESQADNFS